MCDVVVLARRCSKATKPSKTAAAHATGDTVESMVFHMKLLGYY